MAKFSEQQTAIESVFASSEWLSGVAGTVKVLPGNFQGAVSQTEFLRLEILPARIRADYRNLGTAGQVVVQIYTKGNTGISRSMQIADALDESLQTKLFTTTNGSIQTGPSALAVLGTDEANEGLYRVDYVLTYNYFAN
jgi:hypothetical protein